MSRYSGDSFGLSYGSPSVTMTAPNQSVNSGLSFDLPLAAVTASQNRALQFVSANAMEVGAALLHVSAVGGAGIEQTINASGARVTQTNQSILARLSALTAHAFNYGQNAFNTGANLDRYIAKKSTQRGLLGSLF